MEYIQDSLFGKMYPEHSQATKARTSAPSAKNSSKSSSRPPLCLRFLKTDGPMRTVIAVKDGRLHIEFLTHNTGEFPSAVVESTLSSILEASAPEKYYLSAKACEGILRRAERRGKELPPMLKTALEQMIERERSQVEPTAEERFQTLKTCAELGQMEADGMIGAYPQDVEETEAV